MANGGYRLIFSGIYRITLVIFYVVGTIAVSKHLLQTSKSQCLALGSRCFIFPVVFPSRFDVFPAANEANSF